MSFPFVKGHGTRNDFVVLPDLDGTVHGDLEPEVVAALCDRRAGLGADGVLRVLRGDVDGGADWFMDYRNADGSVSQMCGNGIRVFARYLAEAGLVDVAALPGALPVDTRDGIKLVSFCDDGEISVDMGNPKVAGEVTVSVDGRTSPGRKVDLGNPHAVVFVDELHEAGELARSPYYCSAEYPDGVNVEFVVREGTGALAMRVFERGVGETWSCGTGACAVVAAVVVADSDAPHPAPAAGFAGSAALGAPESAPGFAGSGTDRPASAGPGSGGPGASGSGFAGAKSGGPEGSGGLDLPATYTVDVPGGRLTVTWGSDDHIHLKGPALLVASGTWPPAPHLPR